MKLCSLKDDSTYIGDTKEEAFISFGELARLASINSNLPDSLSFSKYRDPEYGCYSLCLCYLGMLNSFIFGSISNKYYFSIKDVRKAFAGIEGALFKVKE